VADKGSILGGADLQNIQSDITTVVNGGITNTNISSSAAIDESKLAFSTMTGHTHNGTDARLITDNIVALLSTTAVSLAANADTTIYTVPAGKRCILSHAILVAGADAGASSTIAIGQNTAETDFLAAHTLSNLDAANDAVILIPVPNTTPLKGKSYAAATVIQAQVANQSGGASNTLFLFGTLYDA